MGSANNKRNRRLREAIHRNLDHAMRLLAEGNIDSARRMLDTATSSLKHAPWNGGQSWIAASDRFRQVKTSLDAPCDCWFCRCQSDQKQKIREATTLKAADLSSAYPNPET